MLPEDDCLWDIQEQGLALLTSHGYHQYEVSAHARDGQQARHNLNYWQFGDFLGIGAGARGDRPQRAGTQLLSDDELPFEFMMNALRLTAGVPTSLFAERTGLSLEVLTQARQQAQQRGLLSANPQHLTATHRGQLFLNDLLQIFLEPAL